ncbi:hypothetical protein KCP75_24240 [Salmonella enterica subsp. enterica]|nr:hypothetical protein KCP75_24240 [Salmonella enterica subsp. enterica]
MPCLLPLVASPLCTGVREKVKPLTIIGGIALVEFFGSG